MTTPPCTRRQFLKTTAAAGAVVTRAPLAVSRLHGAGSSAPAPTPSWVDKPMRWAQLTLVEDDPGKFDVAFWLDYFKRTQSDAVCLSGGGCVAYYPTTIPLHHRSAWLGDRDVLGELISGCRKLNMVVIARTDPHATYDDAAEAHPDWIAVDANGNKRRHWASPEMWVTCGLGPYNFEFMTAVKREIMTRYRVDGIFINRWSGSGQCYWNIAGNISRTRPGSISRARTIRRTRRGARTFFGDNNASLICGRRGIARFARSIPTPASFPTRAAAPRVRWT